MADTTPAPSAQAGGLMRIGEVAARNIALALNLGEEHVSNIEQAIKDEIAAMSSHFTLAVSDLGTQFELLDAKYKAELAQIKSGFTYVKANKLLVAGVSVALLLVGGVVGHLV